MGRKSKFTPEQKNKACLDYINGYGSFENIALNLGVHREVVRIWYLKYKEYGPDAFIENDTNKSYTQEFKMQIVKEYLNGTGSFTDIATKHNISYSMVNQWVSKYNNGEELRDYNPRSEVYAMKSRKTTFEERIEIVKYAITNNNDYKGASDKYSVKYSLVYQWVKKYNELGEEGLKFQTKGRPSKKVQKELTELEKKDIEIERLKLELEKHKRAEEILKKNIEIHQKLFKDSHK